MGIFSIVLYNTSSCLLRAIGDSTSPLFFLIISSFLNIFLDLLFILVFHMGVAGAAWATVLSQFLSGFACVIYIIKKYPILCVTRKDFSRDVWFAKKHLEIGFPMACQFSITAIGCIVLQGAINVFGAAKIAGYTAAQKAEMLFTTAAVSFGVTMANYTGQSLVAKEYSRIKQGTNAGAIICGLTAAGAMIIVLLFWQPISNLFIDLKGSNASECLEAARIYIFSTAPFYIALFEIFIYRNVLQAMGFGLMPLLAGVFELIARVVVSYTLPEYIGYISVCLAGPIAWLAAVIPLAITYYRKKIPAN
jgi:Na+-driven multidrug efflux pump